VLEVSKLRLVELFDKVFFLEGKNGGRYPFSNSLFIDDEVKVLIDTGFGKEFVEKFLKEKRVDLVINSHCHEDHTSCNYLFRDARICCHRLDAPAIRSVNELLKRYGPSGDEVVESIRVFLKDMFGLRNSRVDFEFEDNYVFDLGDVKLQVIHAPGHSIGHCCFFIPIAKIVFLSDIDLTGFGPWYGCLDSDIDQFIDSINKVKKLRPKIAVSSHKGIIVGKDIIQTKLDEYLQKIFERESKLLKLLKERELNINQIVDKAIIYGKFPDPKNIFKHFERIMVEKHLNRLIKSGFINKTKRGFKVVKYNKKENVRSK